MQSHLEDSLQILEEAQKSKSYGALIAQLKKDFGLANIDLRISGSTLPENLITELHEKIYRLILEQFQEYLNVLYIIDVPEIKVKAIVTTDVVDRASAVTLLILQREWQKIVLRQKYGG